MPDIVVLDLFRSGGGMIAKIGRVDGSEVDCVLIVNRDGSLGLKQPRGEWLVERPQEQLEGQSTFGDVGDPEAVR